MSYKLIIMIAIAIAIAPASYCERLLYKLSGANILLASGNRPHSDSREDFRRKHTYPQFFVYESHEVDQMFGSTIDRIDSYIATSNKRQNYMESLIDERFLAIREETKEAVDRIPQRLISTEAAKAIRESVLEDLRHENQRLQGEINNLRQELLEIRAQLKGTN